MCSTTGRGHPSSPLPIHERVELSLYGTISFHAFDERFRHAAAFDVLWLLPRRAPRRHTELHQAFSRCRFLLVLVLFRSRHARHDAPYQVVIVRFGHLDRHEFAGVRKPVIDVHLTVDFRRLALVTADQQVLGLGADAFDQHLEALADELLVLLAADALLNGHDFSPAALDGLLGHLVLHLERGGALFIGVLEDAEALEAQLFDEVLQQLEVFFGLAGQADDERGAEGEAFDARTQLLEQRDLRNAESRPRFIDISSLSDACCSGMSRYLAIFGSVAITSMSSLGKTRG